MADIAAAERTALQSCALLLRWLRSGQLGDRLRAWWRLRCAARLLRASPAFDARWYRATYPDIATAGIDPASHYLRRGAAEGRAPLPVANPPLPRLALTDTNYRAWVAIYDTPCAEQLVATRMAIDRLAWRPTFGVVVFRGDHGAEAMTLESLEAQLYPDWCLIEAPSGDVMLFLPAGTLLAPTALYHIAAAVAAAPSVELVYADEDQLDLEGRRIKPWFKPAWDPVLATECDLLGFTGVYRRRLLDRLGVTKVTNRVTLREVAQRAANAVPPEAVRHIPLTLFHLRSETTTSLPLPLRAWAAKRTKVGGRGRRETRTAARCSQTRPPILNPCRDPSPPPQTETLPRPLVSIIIPTRDHATLLARCVDGLLNRTDYAPIELLIIDNDSRQRRTARLLTRLAADPRVRVLRHPGPFNWSAMNNAAVREARGEIIVLLNNDIDVINPAWLREMIILAQQPDTGIVGARLLYPDGTLQHAGMTIGPGAVTGHLCRGAARHDPGHGGMLRHTRSVAAVTGACMVMRRTVFETVCGLESEHLAVTNNDLDFCLRVRARGWRVVCTPRAELYHHDAASRGPDLSVEQLARVQQERAYLMHRWGTLAEHDPYLSPNLSTVNEQLVLAAPAMSPRRAIATEWRGDTLDVGQQIGRQTGGLERGPADIQRVG
jgi:GT2 family glycosyltransferase